MSKKLGSSYVVYMGLIPFDWDDAVIKSVVCGTGSVVDVRLGFDYVGKNKGFCFIEYISQSDASRAMLLLEQMKIVNPQTNQIKKIRVELSKESLKVNQDNDFKQPLMLTFNNLPDNVILAREQYVNGPPLPSTNMGLNNTTTTTNPNLFLPNIPPQLPPVPQYGYNNGYSNNNNNNINNINSNNNHNNNINNNKNNINVINNKLNNSTQPQSNSNTLGPEFTNASQRLPPQPETLPFDVLGNINKTLSQIPPVLLIEFISNLKNTLNGPNAGQAVNVLQLSPNLASSTAQALLLMGFIDEQVINEAVTNVQNPRSASHTPVPLPQNILPPPPPPPQQQQQGYGGYSIPGSNNYGATVPNYPPPPTAVNLNPNWAHFSHSTQSKLAALPSNEADVIVQVLNLPADQISLLPAEQQGIFTNIRAQYLG
ncbi:uncharacterized protein KQ657_004697 [Scheffersomyces spartinae]|uniref:RRM domain-containing protein n=1 Tax=Scheffersomyces spartinae TaxID=45513 RepID=A0A9P7VAP1_9ASCO|nr:uncharacterized protein KQ657_004697 [Scheffersomyces spartinae]KAG7194483.1 hypothetical protein KQ657_004697 [Scheffersomyces spartinae]